MKIKKYNRYLDRRVLDLEREKELLRKEKCDLTDTLSSLTTRVSQLESNLERAR